MESKITEKFIQGKRKLVREIGGKITEKFIRGKRNLIREVGRFEESRIQIGIAL